MSDLFRTSGPAISQDLSNCTSSPASEAGHTPYDSRVSPIITRYGLEAVLASLSPRQAKELGLLTSGTYGRPGFTSSASAALQLSLASRLHRRMGSAGTILFKLTWKVRATPSGRPISALRASALRTSGKDFGSWPTPMAGTPAQKGYNEAGNNDSSRKTVALVSGLAAPMEMTVAIVPDARAIAGEPQFAVEEVAATIQTDAMGTPAGWATPAARDFKSESATDEFNARRWSHARGKPLSAEATLAAWSAPRANKWGFPDVHGSHEAPISGPTATGSPAPTENKGQLDPAHSLWLQGYPPEYLNCAPSAIRSTHTSRRNS